MWKRIGLVLLFITYIFLPACSGGGQVAGALPVAAIELPNVPQTVETNENSGELDPTFGQNGSGFTATAE